MGLTQTTLVCHSFDDGQESNELFQTGDCRHVRLDGYPLNANFNEASVVDWVDEHGIPDADFVGLAHYRRRLLVREPAAGRKYVRMEVQPMPLGVIWCYYHSEKFMKAFLDAWDEAAPGGAEQFYRYLVDQSSRFRYKARNLFLLERSDFEEWIRLMKEVRKPLERAMEATKADPIWSDRYQKRQPGFVCERITSWFLDRLPKECVDAPYAEIQVESPYQRESR